MMDGSEEVNYEICVSRGEFDIYFVRLLPFLSFQFFSATSLHPFPSLQPSL